MNVQSTHKAGKEGGKEGGEGGGGDGGGGGGDGNGGGEDGPSDTEKVTSFEGLVSLMLSRMISTPFCEMATNAPLPQPVLR